MFDVLAILLAIGIVASVLTVVGVVLKLVLGILIIPFQIGFWLLKGVLALVLGIVFTAIGLAIQAPFTWYLMTYGVDYGEIASNTASDAGVVFDTVMKARIDWFNLAYYSVMGVVLTVIAGVWPAWRATRMQPVEAMRHA